MTVEKKMIHALEVVPMPSREIITEISAMGGNGFDEVKDRTHNLIDPVKPSHGDAKGDTDYNSEKVSGKSDFCTFKNVLGQGSAIGHF